MRNALTLMVLAGVCSLAFAQTAPDKPAATAEKPAGHDMSKMGSMMARMHPPLCLYEGKGYSQGAVHKVRGVTPTLVCDAPEAPQPIDSKAAADGGHSAHSAPALRWMEYRTAKAKPAASGHQH